MAHHPEPFYRIARKGWFVQLGKRQLLLGHDADPRRDRKSGKPIPSQGKRFLAEDVIDKSLKPAMSRFCLKLTGLPDFG